MAYQIIQGDNRDTLRTFPDNHFDSVITDPPYGIDFLGKTWDVNTGALETYQECLRVLKPGGHILAFSAARTYHHLAITLEQAGFEIRDQIMWIYSSGFPKSQDVGRQIQRKLGVKEYEEIVDTTKNAGFGMTDHARVRAGEEWSTGARQVGKVRVTDPEAQKWSGWGTALKPAHEPIALARKPLSRDNSIARNCEQWGVGALNIDATRVPWGKDDDPEAYVAWMQRYPASTGSKAVFNNAHADAKGVDYVQDQDAEINADRNVHNRLLGRFPSNVIGEIEEPYQKYFYCPKVSRKERHVGFDLKDIGVTTGGMWDKDGTGVQYNAQKVQANGNNHPTVKPIELMKYLIQLITPAGGHVLDPFNGSGSTGMAAVELDYNYTGCELDPAYVKIAEQRIAAWYAATHPLEATGLWE